MPPIVRELSPRTHSDYTKYKPYLWLEFEATCAYCHIPEKRNGPLGNYHIDHFRPKSKSDLCALIDHYSNLYYVCGDCNRFKGDTWPDSAMQAHGCRFLDPCVDDFVLHWNVEQDGTLTAKTLEGDFMIDKLHLNRTRLVEWRRGKLQLQNRVDRLSSLLSRVACENEVHSAVMQELADLKGRIFDEYGHFW